MLPHLASVTTLNRVVHVHMAAHWTELTFTVYFPVFAAAVQGVRNAKRGQVCLELLWEILWARDVLDILS